MRIIISALLAIIVLTSTPMDSYSQKVVRVSKYSQSISADLIYFAIFKTFRVTYEHRLVPNNSFTVFGDFINYSSDWTAFSVGGSYKWYINLGDMKALPVEGFSVGPLAGFSFWDYTKPAYYSGQWEGYGGFGMFVGGEASAKWVFGGFVVEPVLRLSFYLMSADFQPTNYNPWGLGVNLGYAW